MTGIDVLIDSLVGSRMDQLPVVVSPLPESLKLDGRPAVGATLYYVFRTETLLRETSAQCPSVEGITFRVNGARLKGAMVSIVADRPVRITVRKPSGEALGTALTLAPGDSALAIEWHPPRPD